MRPCNNGFAMDTKPVVDALLAHFGTEEALAAALGVGQSTINRWTRGGSIRGENLLKLVDLARRTTSAAHLAAGLMGEASATTFAPVVVPGSNLVGQRDFPVYAAAQGGDGHQIITFEAIDYVKRPAILEHVSDGYGIYVVGESMVPAFESGDMALVNPRLPPARDRNVVLYHTPPSEAGGEVEAIIKRLVGMNDRDWSLMQWNPKHEFVEARADWPICHRIVGKYEAR